MDGSMSVPRKGAARPMTAAQTMRPKAEQRGTDMSGIVRLTARAPVKKRAIVIDAVMARMSPRVLRPPLKAPDWSSGKNMTTSATSAPTRAKTVRRGKRSSSHQSPQIADQSGCIEKHKTAFAAKVRTKEYDSVMIEMAWRHPRPTEVSGCLRAVANARPLPDHAAYTMTTTDMNSTFQKTTAASLPPVAVAHRMRTASGVTHTTPMVAMATPLRSSDSFILQRAVQRCRAGRNSTRFCR
mmetsp:Transcript_2518/g.6476  ORF Transcript_2518/g.6476 Transcript_2518/m.6476 type:complete len:240 (-) Transcript_2518:21-740(-)